MVQSFQHGKPLSAGVIVWDGKKFILGHATNAKHWDIPKGKIEPNEVAIAAAVRELEEETGIKVDYRKLMHIGVFHYKKDKDLSLYLYKVDRLPKVKDLKCVSTFSNKHGMVMPEFDKFSHVSFKQASKKTVPAMNMVLVHVETLLKLIKR